MEEMEEKRNMLYDERDRLLLELSSIEAGTDEYDRVLRELDQLSKILLETDKFDLQCEEYIRKGEEEKEAKLDETAYRTIANAEENRWKWRRYWLDAASIGVPLLVYLFVNHEGMKFEQTGVISSDYVKGLVRLSSKLFKFK